MSDEYKTDIETAEDLGDWPHCSTPDCSNGVCFRFKNGKCWPCTMGMPPNWWHGWADRPREIASRAIEADYWERVPK